MTTYQDINFRGRLTAHRIGSEQPAAFRRQRVVPDVDDGWSDEGWRRRAQCRDTDPELFFPDERGSHARQNTTLAKAICAHCTVTEPCLTYAIGTGQNGIWGGTTDQERAEARRSRRRPSPSPKGVPA